MWKTTSPMMKTPTTRSRRTPISTSGGTSRGGERFRSEVKVWDALAGQELLTLLSSQFIHAGFLHLGGNMLFLWVFGRAIEDRVGPAVYLVFYLLAGALAAPAKQTFTGVITDHMCAETGHAAMRMGPTDAECVGQFSRGPVEHKGMAAPRESDSTCGTRVLPSLDGRR